MEKKVGLYREADAGGSTGGTSTQADASTSTALQAKIVSLEAELGSQRNIQAGLDRTVSQKEKQVSNLESELNSLRTVTTSDSEALKALQDERDGLLVQVNEMTDKFNENADIQTQLSTTQNELNRLNIVVAEYPDLLHLAANDALPRAENDEDFKLKLASLSETIGRVAANRQADLKSGSRPSSATPPGGTQNLKPEEYAKLAGAAFDEGNTELGEKYLNEYRSEMLKEITN